MIREILRLTLVVTAIGAGSYLVALGALTLAVQWGFLAA